MKRKRSELFGVRFLPGNGALGGAGERGAAGGAPLAVEKWLLRKLLAGIGDPRWRVRLWDGADLPVPVPEPRVTMVVRSRAALWKLLTNPSLNFGDEYCAGGIEVEGDLGEFMEAYYRASLPTLHNNPLKKRLFNRLNRPRRNTPSGSRDNIHRHYDIGNEFYRLWLDKELLYTCAYFPDPGVSLEAAQLAKMDHVCRKLRLKPGETVVEAGCGWGSLARHMAKHYGVKVKAYNISREQVAYARERAKAEGFAHQVQYFEDDYRSISGTFDAFVSVGMLEHVGKANYRQLGEVIDRCLTPSGRGLIHTIGQNTSAPLSAWVEKRIFPGGYPPCLREMMEVFEPWGFSVLDVENIRLHYAKTLEHWLARFDGHIDDIGRMFDEPFIRAWRLYLAGARANFSTGSLQLFQVVFTRPDNNDIPWTRAHLYGERGDGNLG